MKSFIIEARGYHENSTMAPSQFTIVHLDLPLGELITMELINEQLAKELELSPYRNNKDIIIKSMQGL